MTRSAGSKLILWSTAVFGLLSALIASLYYRNVALPQEGLAISFIVLAFIGHFSFFSFLVNLPIHIINIISPNKKLILTLLAIFNAMFVSVLVFDIHLFSLYKFHINAMVWGLLTGGAAGDIFEFSDSDYIYSILVSLSVVAVALFGVLLANKFAKKAKKGWLVLCSLVSMMIVGQGMYAYSDAQLYQPVIRQISVIPWALPVTARGFFAKHNLVEERTDVKIEQYSEGLFNYPKQPLSCQKNTASAKNILLLVVDTMRFDVLTEEVMPNANALANSGSRYMNHYSTGNGTRFGMFGLFYGLFGNYWTAALTENKPSVLIDTLDNQGYDFGIFASAALTSPEFDRTIFATIKDRISLRTQGANKAERDLAISAKFEDYLENRNKQQPFFSMLFFDAAHGYATSSGYPVKFTPNLKTISYASLNNDSDPVPFFNRYKNSLHFIDSLIGRAVKALKENGDYENTVIVLTSDHGQEFNDTKLNSWGHNSNFSKWQTKVPMIIVDPEKESKTYQHLTSHVDVAPTLIDNVLNCSTPYESYSQGWPLDQGKGHDLLTLSSWTNFALFDGDKTSVFYQTGFSDVYDENYELQKSIRPKNKQVLQSIELNSEFLR